MYLPTNAYRHLLLFLFEFAQNYVYIQMLIDIYPKLCVYIQMIIDIYCWICLNSPKTHYIWLYFFCLYFLTGYIVTVSLNRAYYWQIVFCTISIYMWLVIIEVFLVFPENSMICAKHLPNSSNTRRSVSFSTLQFFSPSSACVQNI